MDEDLFESVNPIAIPRKRNLYIKKDYIRALQVICRWKNFLFVVITLCLLVLQTSFLLVNYGYVVPEANANIKAPSVLIKIEKQLTNLTEEGLEKEPKAREPSDSEITFRHVTLVMNITNTILILSSVLYGFVMFCGLGASLGGGLGGMAHISRAFVYSLIILIFLLPWQFIFKYTIIGVIYTPRELAMWRVTDITGMFGKVLLYLRFTGYPILVFILLLLAQLRSSVWNKAVVRRLDQ